MIKDLFAALYAIDNINRHALFSYLSYDRLLELARLLAGLFKLDKNGCPELNEESIRNAAPRRGRELVAQPPERLGVLCRFVLNVVFVHLERHFIVEVGARCFFNGSELTGYIRDVGEAVAF